MCWSTPKQSTRSNAPSLERQVEEVGLREVESLVLAEVRARGVDRGRRVDRPDLRAGVEQDLREASRAAAELEHRLAA